MRYPSRSRAISPQTRAVDAAHTLRILLLEDDPGYSRLVQEYLLDGAIGAHHVQTASTLAAAVDAIREHPPDVIIADLGLPDAEGDEVVPRLRDAGKRIPIVILSGQEDIEKALDIIQDGAQEFLVKGRCEEFFLTRAIRAAIERKRFEEFERLLIGIVSHDLRSPMQTIRGVIDILELDNRAHELTSLASRALTRAVTLINDLLDITKLRIHGLLPITIQQADIRACVQSVVDELRLARPERTISLDTDGDTQGWFDVTRMSQVLVNLIDNAVQYSPVESLVTVTCRGRSDALTIAVHNTGAPIPPQALAHLFQPLERLDSANPRRGSIGLGLYITDQIVRSHQGTISVTSCADEGTTFRITLPRTSEQTIAVPPARPAR